jgi:multidrug efflux system membrane fusion protein
MNQSVKIALGISVVLSLYMLTGLVGCGKKQKETPIDQEVVDKAVMFVRVSDLVATDISRTVVMTGKTEPSRAVDIKSETVGKVFRVGDRRGKATSAGTLIAEIEINDRLERLEQAKAALEEAKLQYDAAIRLQDKELRSASDVAQSLSALRGAEQRVRAIELDIRNTRLVVPFDGVLQDRFVEVGDYLGIGDPVARILDVDPIVVSAQATEFQIAQLKIGEHGVARLPSGKLVDGFIRYVAGESDSQSRTFLIELEVENPEMDIRAGLTARLEVETERVPAYRISPGQVSVLDDGRFGVKIVDENNRVVFVEADIVQSEPDALWLGSLPEKIRLITVGQGYVRDGDLVEFEVEASTAQ